jgi:hypothetical protein
MVDRRKTGRVGRALLACALLLLAAGCCYRPRHGVIIRGDWSLEFNRVPWLVSRTESLQECSVPRDGCPAECVPTEVRGQGPVAGQTGCDGTSCVAGSGRSRLFCRRCGRRLSWRPGEPDSTAGCYGHPRFHPVPTRPVFRPRTEYYSSIPELEGQQEAGGADADPVRTDPSGVPPAVELIPTPNPDLGQGWREKQSPDGGGGSGSSLSTPSSTVELKVSEVEPSRPDPSAADGRVPR